MIGSWFAFRSRQMPLAHVPAPPPSGIDSAVLPQTSGADVNQTLSVVASPDGKTVAIATAWGLVRQINLSTGAVLPSTKRHNDWVTAVTYSADGKHLVSAGGSEFAPERNGGKTSARSKSGIWSQRRTAAS